MLYYIVYENIKKQGKRDKKNSEEIFSHQTPRQINLQSLRKVQIWAFGLLVHRIISLKEVLKLKQNFQKTKVVTSKTKFSGIGPFCARHSICLNIDF